MEIKIFSRFCYELHGTVHGKTEALHMHAKMFLAKLAVSSDEKVEVKRKNMLVGLTYSLFQSQKSKEATSTTKLVTE
jgi:hypothetical protein